MTRLLPLICLPLLACKAAPPAANPEFNDALAYAFRSFEGDQADLAFAVRSLEEQVYLSVDVEADNSNDRALTPASLSEEDVADVDHPSRDPGLCIAVAVAGLSSHPVDRHAELQLLSDQTPIEPYSPDQYDRTFLEGEDCWLGGACEYLRTENDLVKDNFLMTIPYVLYKDFRWVDLDLPDPADVAEGEEAVNEGEPRWAVVARAWTTEAAEGESGANTIHQSYTVEMWVPRDGGGFVRQGGESNADGGEWTSDSEGGGVLRMLALWTETELGGLNIDDDTVANTTRSGIDKNFEEAEDYLDGD